ncbi:MAG TPA: glycogen synthase GlgA [Pseudomonadota bacterium]|nr:glycogen synthase GlgA [Pseudomonadota bacterium]
MNVLHVASEVAPFSKTGGLGDVLWALPKALAQQGAGRVTVVSARYGSIDPQQHGLAKRLRKLAVSVGGQSFEVGLYEGRLPGPGPQVMVYLIDHPLFADRPGVYGPPGNPGEGYPDNALRFALLSQAAICLAKELTPRPDVIHAHDWQAGLAVYYAQKADWDTPPATVFTVHNLMFQGLFSLAEARHLGMRDDLLTPDGIEFYGQASFIKAGLQLADRLTTVSPRYAEEIATPEFGYGLDGVMRARSARLSGILNGVDYDRWSPWSDGALPARFGKPAAELDALSEDAFAADLVGKARCKAELQRELSLPLRPRTPLLATISRLTDQKGIDLLIEWLESELTQRTEFQFVLLGQGDPAFEQRLRMLSERFPTRLAVRLAFDEGLAHRIEAGSDFFVMPSRFEPCGLNQIYSMRYATVPIVRATGGLYDTVVDFDARSRSGTGFTFQPFSVAALGHAVRRALSAYHSDEQSFLGLQKRAMRADFGWAASARAYLNVYRQAQSGK